MPGLLETCRDLFDTDDLYTVLGINRNATDDEVKRGYRKTSLRVHPDRAEEDEKDLATKKFQALSQAYSILSDGEKRAVYDDTGEIDDENDIQQDRDWFDYWRILFPKITEEDILNFEKNYKGSEEERADLKEAYLKFQGDMDQIVENVMCSSVDDESRFIKIIKEMIKKKEVKDFPDFSKENKKKKSARKRQAEKEAAEVEEVKKQFGLDDDDSLTALIQKNRQNRGAQAEDFFSQLEEKYAKPKQKAKSKKK